MFGESPLMQYISYKIIKKKAASNDWKDDDGDGIIAFFASLV